MLMKSNLSVISFMGNAFGIIPKKLLLYPRASRFSLMLFARSFIVLPFILSSMIHLELILVKGVRFVFLF